MRFLFFDHINAGQEPAARISAGCEPLPNTCSKARNGAYHLIKTVKGGDRIVVADVSLAYVDRVACLLGSDPALPALCRAYTDVVATIGGDVGKPLARLEGGSLAISGERFACEIPDTEAGRDLIELVHRRIMPPGYVVFIPGPARRTMPVTSRISPRALTRVLHAREIPMPATATHSRAALFGVPVAELLAARSHGGGEELTTRALATTPGTEADLSASQPLTHRDYRSRVLAAVTLAPFDRGTHVRVPVVAPAATDDAATYVPAAGRFPLADIDLNALMTQRRAEKIGIQRRFPEDVRQDFGPAVVAAFERACLNDVGRATDAALLHGLTGTPEPFSGLIAQGTTKNLPGLPALVYGELSAAMARIEVRGEATAVLVSGDVRHHLRDTLTRDQRDQLPPIVHIHGAQPGTAVVLDGAMVGIGVRTQPTIRLAENVPGDFEADLVRIAVSARVTDAVLADTTAVQTLRVAA